MVGRYALPWFWCLALALPVGAAPRGDELPPPVDEVRFLPDSTGEDIGLPLGATATYALGRSLYQQGDVESALIYLNRAYRLAPGSWRISEAFAQALQQGGYFVDAARIYGDLVAVAPDSLAQRRQYAVLLAQSGRAASALAQLAELRRRGGAGPEIVKLEADMLGQLGRIEDALAAYREAAAQDPENREGYLLASAVLLQRHERHAEMAALLREGLQQMPASRLLRSLLLRYLVTHGQIREAINEAAVGDAARLVAGATLQPDCSLELAEILARRDDLKTASAVLTDLLADGHRDADLEAQLARYQLGLNEPAAAAATMEVAVGRWPAVADLHFLLGRARELTGDIDGALAAVRTAGELAPGQAGYHVALLRLLVLHRADALAPAATEGEAAAIRREATSRAARAAGLLQPQDYEGHLILGYTYRNLGDLELACRHFHLAGGAAETKVSATLELSVCLQEMGRTEEAQAVLRTLQAEYPDDPEVANNLGYLLAELGQDLQLAEQLVRQAMRSDPENAAYLDSLGWVFYQRGEYAEAFEWLVAAVNQRPDDPLILEHLGLTLKNLGRFAEATDMLRRARQRGGDPERLDALLEELAGER
jgi:tetratricopeptide (TPR) repeat protein